MNANNINFTLGGKVVSLDRQRIKQLASMMAPAEGEDAAASLATAMESTGLTSWGPVVELEPDAPVLSNTEA